MKDIENCPKCNTEIVDAKGIGPFCPNKQCDVSDNLIIPECKHDRRSEVFRPKHTQTCTNCGLMRDYNPKNKNALSVTDKDLWSDWYNSGC